MGFCVVFMYFFSQETSLKNGAVIICLLASKFLSLRIFTQCYTRAGSNCPKTLKQKTKALTCLEQQHETIQLLLQTCSYLGKVLLITANPLLQFTCWSWQKNKQVNITSHPHFKAFLASNESALLLNYLLWDSQRNILCFLHTVFHSQGAHGTQKPLAIFRDYSSFLILYVRIDSQIYLSTFC